jgi:hypothetical protein
MNKLVAFQKLLRYLRGVALAVVWCGGTEVEDAGRGAHDVAVDPPRLVPRDDGFRPVSPVNPVAAAIAAGREAGSRARAAARQLGEDFDLDSEETQHLSCFLASRAIDDEIPQTPEQFEEELVEYFGEELADEIEESKWVAARDDLLDAVEQVDEEGFVSASTAVNAVCDA